LSVRGIIPPTGSKSKSVHTWSLIQQAKCLATHGRITLIELASHCALVLMLIASASDTGGNCPPPPSAPHLFSSFSCGKFILLLSFRQQTPLDASARWGRLEITRLLVESKADVAARDMCFSPPPSHHLSLTIRLAALAPLHSK
jgi:hypothetical protein